MGLFLLAVIAAGFGFVYWLENSGGFGEREAYRIRFSGPVSGLLTGSSVLFNGIRVGEVTALRINANQPNEVDAEVAVNTQTPIRSNTLVDLEYQGLTGVASISLTGTAGGTPLMPTSDGPPMLQASASAGQTITHSARIALLKLNSILDENSEPFKELVANLNSFAGALSRNSDKVDGILSGLERMTGGARGPDTEKVFDITAADGFKPASEKLRGQMIVPQPTAIFQLDSQNILFRAKKDDAPLPPGARWADNLTRLMQSKVVQSFENAGYLGSVSQNADVVTAEFQLLIDIRNFQIITTPEPTADVEYSAKIADTNGKILGAKLFKATAPAKSTESGPAVEALNAAFHESATELVTWAADILTKPVKAEEQPEAAPDTGTQPAPTPEAQPAPKAEAQPAPAPSTEAQQPAAAPTADGQPAPQMEPEQAAPAEPKPTTPPQTDATQPPSTQSN